MYAKKKNGDRTYHWKFKDKLRLIPVPESKHFWNYDREARKLSHQYVQHLSLSEPVFKDYLSKLISLNYTDYYAFRRKAEEVYPNEKLSFHEIYQFYDDIYNQSPPSRKTISIFKSVSPFVKFVVYALQSAFFCLISSDKVSTSSVLYIRKKVMPDLAMSDNLGELVEKNNISFSKTFSLFSNQKTKYDFNFLNNYKGSFMRAIKSLTLSLLSGIRYFRSFYQLNLPNEYFFQFLKHSFLMNNILLLNPKVVCGVLLDKPFFTLLKLYKRNHQKIVSLNESFSFSPYTNFDFNHLDVYFAMNKMELTNLNEISGEIKRVEFVEFYRKNLKANSNGISNDIKSVLERYNQRVLLTTCQTPDDTFYPWSKIELIKFLNACKMSAIENKKALFVLKGKKGELDFLSQQQRQEIESLPNLIVINSVTPKLNKFNQFEDLLTHFDLLISMSVKSTTMWQALSHGIPFIGVNDNHDSTFLAEYNFLEVSSENLLKAVEYRLSEKSKEEWRKTQSELIDLLNIKSSSGLEKASKIICEVVHE